MFVLFLVVLISELLVSLILCSVFIIRQRIVFRLLCNSFYNDGRVDSPVLAAIRSVYDNGGVVSGISAGLAAQPWTFMIMGQYMYIHEQFGSAFEK